MKITGVASVSPIVSNPAAAQGVYRDALGVPFEGSEGEYVFTERLPGVKHFGLWPLSEAAQACFGTEDWPGEHQVPQASVEFEVGSEEEVAAAAAELREQGVQLVHDVKREPWGQSITRLLTPDGLLVGICYTPWLHEGPAGQSHDEPPR